MASKNLGAVIQRAISDGAFRRQLQSDPAAALRGFNLTPDEIAAVRSGDSSRLMSLGVDSRMSKAFTVGGAALENPSRAALSDVSGNTSSALTGDNTAGAREGLASDQTTGARAASSDGQNSGAPASGARATISDGQTSGSVHEGARASVSAPQGDAYRAVNDPDNTSGSRAAIGDPTAAGTHASITAPQGDAYRAVNDPDSTSGSRAAIGDPTAAGTHASITAPQGDAYRAVNDPDSTGGTRESVSAPQGDAYRPIHDPDNDSVASRMQDTNTALPGSDVQHDPGFVDSHSAFVPSDSADAQRELLDAEHHGDALGDTGHGINS